MLKRTAIVFLSVFLLVGALSSVFTIQKVKAGTITVPDDYPTIQEAIDHASMGDTVFVKAGTYHENVEVNKSMLSLLGENMATTIIDGDQAGDCVHVIADSAKICGLTIRNASGVYSCVKLSSDWNEVVNCNLTDGWCGVSIDRFCGGNVIANNSISDNLNGISGELWWNSRIVNNTIVDNLLGIWIGPYSKNNEISFNIIKGHYSEGISMWQSSNNTFEANDITDNNRGGYWAAIVIGFQVGASWGNKFFHNNIMSKGRQVDLQGRQEPIIWDDGYPSGGNYWSDYNGTDVYSGPYQNASRSDGIGDAPYLIDENNVDRYPLIHPLQKRNPPIWDVNNDKVVDIQDIVLVALAYGSKPGDSNWKPEADMAPQQGKVDLFDLVTCASHYGERYR